MDYVYRSTPRTEVTKSIFTASEYPPRNEIALHNENSYQRNWPMKLVFCCIRAAEYGGATTIADMRRVTELIGPELVECFDKSGVRYLRHYRQHVDLPWQTVFQTDSKEALREFCDQAGIEHRWLADGTLRTAQSCQGVALHPQTRDRLFFNQAHLFHPSCLGPAAVTALTKLYGAERLPRNVFFGDGSEIPVESLCLVRSALQEHARDIRWRAGDVLLLDNMLVAHGRRPFVGHREVLTALLEPRFPDVARQPPARPDNTALVRS